MVRTHLQNVRRTVSGPDHMRPYLWCSWPVFASLKPAESQRETVGLPIGGSRGEETPAQLRDGSPAQPPAENARVVEAEPPDDPVTIAVTMAEYCSTGDVADGSDAHQAAALADLAVAESQKYEATKGHLRELVVCPVVWHFGYRESTGGLLVLCLVAWLLKAH
eukprot:gene12557-15780_t